MRLTALGALWLALMLTPALAGAPTINPDADSETWPALPQPQEWRLANGLRLFVLPSGRAPVVTHAIAYQVGSKDDPPAQSGLAHYLEHLMFKDTARAPSPSYAEQIEGQGGAFNAFTSKSITLYYATVPRAALALVMAWEADRMQGLVLDEAEAETERAVILEERSGTVDSHPAALLWEEMQAQLFAGTNFAAPVIGRRAHIAAYRADMARRFYRCHYHPQNAVVVVAGAIALAEARQLAQRHYGALTPAPACPPSRQTAPAATEPLAPVVRRDARAQFPLWQKLYRLPARARRALSDWLALDVLAHILGGEKSGRLYRAHVVAQPHFTHISAWLEDAHPPAAYFGISAVPRRDAPTQEAGPLIAEALAALAATAVPAAELQRAKTALLARLYYAQDDTQELALFYARRLANGYRLAELLSLPAQLQAVTAQEVQAAAAQLQSLPALEGRLLVGEAE